MATNVSGNGTVLVLAASKSFPVGFPITQFPEDGDPIEIENIDIGDTAMGINGDLIHWSKPNPIKVSFSVIPGSVDDINLQMIIDNNTVAPLKLVANDIITLTKLSPDGTLISVFKNGIFINGPQGTSTGGSGRNKSKTYHLAFESKIGV